MKLTDTHLVLLSTAAQHNAHLLTRPDDISDKAGKALASKLVRAGLVEEVSVMAGQPHWHLDSEMLVGLRLTRDGLAALGLEEADTPAAPGSGEGGGPRPSSSPGAGRKRAAVLNLLGREEGATLNDLIAATGWLPHTTRAALTGLRQKGYALAKSKGEDGRSVYRISSETNAAVVTGEEG